MPQTISPTTMAAKVPAGLHRRELAGCDGHDRETVEDERGRVVGKTFAFEHHQHPPWQPKPPRDRERRHHVRRRDDGAEQEADAPIESEQAMRRRRHGGRW